MRENAIYILDVICLSYVYYSVNKYFYIGTTFIIHYNHYLSHSKHYIAFIFNYFQLLSLNQ